MHNNFAGGIRLHGSQGGRRGVVLVIILIVLILLSLAAYGFTEMMVGERVATNYYGRRVQARSFADSGVELMAAHLDSRTFEADENYLHNPESFFRQEMLAGEVARGAGYYTILVPNDRDPNGRGIRYGFASENGKLDVNFLVANQATTDLGEEPEEGEITAIDQLMMIPNMTEEIAAAIIDWIDEDDEPLEGIGAESDYYENLPTPYIAANAPLTTIDELLKIKGITPLLLYGEDVNRNGLLDTNENDADASAPEFDNADGILDRGFIHYLTIYAREANLQSDGEEQLDLSKDVMQEVYQEVEEQLGHDMAQFIIAFRMYGTDDAPMIQDPAPDKSELNIDPFETGLDLRTVPNYAINSIFDLVDREVIAEAPDESEITLTSPWTSANLAETAPIFYDLFKTSEDPYSLGKIDPNHATAEVLMTIPIAEMDETLAASIAANSVVGANGEVDAAMVANRATPAWLFTEGLVDLPTMRILAPYLSTRGGVFKAQIVGYFGEGGPSTRLEAMVDSTEIPSKVVSVRDLTALGKGYFRTHLQPAEQD